MYNLRGFSRNLQKEVTRKSKYYFYDTGIRNALIANFNPLNLRDDIGKLWGYEFKWGKAISKTPKEFLSTYPNAEFMTVNQENYLEFIR